MRTLIESANKYMYEEEKDLDDIISDIDDDTNTLEDDETDIEDVDADVNDEESSNITSNTNSIDELDAYIETMEGNELTYITVITDQEGIVHKIDDPNRREQVYYMLLNDAKDRAKLIRAGEDPDKSDIENDEIAVEEGLLSGHKTQEEQLAKTMVRILKDNAKRYDVNPKTILDYMVVKL